MNDKDSYPYVWQSNLSMTLTDDFYVKWPENFEVWRRLFLRKVMAELHANISGLLVHVGVLIKKNAIKIFLGFRLNLIISEFIILKITADM